MHAAQNTEKTSPPPDILKPGDDALLVTPRAVFAVRVSRIWRSLAGTERVEVRDGRIRPGACFDRRQFIALGALENLPALAAREPAHSGGATEPVFANA